MSKDGNRNSTTSSLSLTAKEIAVMKQLVAQAQAFLTRVSQGLFANCDITLNGGEVALIRQIALTFGQTSQDQVAAQSFINKIGGVMLADGDPIIIPANPTGGGGSDQSALA
jgi:hypothetical protein